MKTSEVQRRLTAIAEELLLLTAELSRRKPVTRAKPTSRRMTEKMKLQARLYAANGFAQHEIAARLKVNPGRVSEALHGKRT